MANALKLINDRARKLKAKNKKLSHIDAISKASAELKREGKIGGPKKATRSASGSSRKTKKGPAKKRKAAKKRTVKKKLYQTGTSNKAYDKQRKALPPGRRVAKKSKRVYTETRANRSDMPGRLTGVNGGRSMYVIRDQFETEIKNAIALRDHIRAGKMPRVDKAKSLKNLNDHIRKTKEQLRYQNSLIKSLLK